MSATGEYRACPGCGARFERRPWALDRDLRASPECWHAYGEVSMFEAGHLPELGALHQLAADAYGAQHGGPPTPPFEVTHNLVGLHLALERGADGGTVQGVRQRMGAPEEWWPRYEQPEAPATTTIADVLREGAEAGSVEGHEAALRRWAAAVWASWAPCHEEIADLVARVGPDR